jgi:hypothetical protein
MEYIAFRRGATARIRCEVGGERRWRRARYSGRILMDGEGDGNNGGDYSPVFKLLDASGVAFSLSRSSWLSEPDASFLLPSRLSSESDPGT